MTENPNLKRCFPSKSLVAYRRNKNLKEHLVRARVSSKRTSKRPKNDYKPCQEGCQLCWISETTSSHSCKRLKKTWRINKPINCKTSNVIYKLTCTKCRDFLYIGETKRRLQTRIGEHRRSITNKLNPPVGKHFAKGHGKNPAAYLRVVGIEKIYGKPDKIDRTRKEREKLWIARYDATEFGANIKEWSISIFANSIFFKK